MLTNSLTIPFDRIIWFIIRYSLLYDTINGAFLHGGSDLPISQSIKIILIILIIFKLVITKYFIRVWLIMTYSFFLFIHFSFIIPIELLGSSINHIFKFLSVPIFFYYIRNQFEQNSVLTLFRIKKVMNTNLFILIGNILIGLLGLGYAQYNGQIGFRGYFYAGNEVSGILLLLFPFTLFQLYIDKNRLSKKYFFYCCLLLLTAVLAVTKTAIIGTVLTLTYIPWICSSRKKKVLLPLILLILPIVGLILYHGITHSGIIDRWLFFYEKDGLWSLLSGRDSRVIESMQSYLKSSLSEQFFGLGGNTTVEMDPFDALFNYGILGAFLVYVFYFYLIVNSYLYKKRKYPYAALAFYCNLLILFTSCFSGHILFSGMAGIFIAIINGLTFYKQRL